MTPPAHVLFDLNGTLVDPAAIADPLPDGAEREGFADAVLADAVMLAAVETITGSFRDFAELLEIAAARQLDRLGARELLGEVLAAARRMHPFPDAAEAIEALRAAGIGTGVLTNSSTESARSLLDGHGLDLDPVVGTDEVGAFKPDRRVYARGVEATGREPEEVALVSAHWWDALGARRAGLGAAWVARREGTRMRVEPSPDHVASDLVDAARQLTSS